MKAILVSVGSSAENAVPAIAAAMACGAARRVDSLSLYRICDSAPAAFTDALLADLNVCHTLFAGLESMPYFRTAFSARSFRPRMPSAGELCRGDNDRLLLDALRGRNMPLSFRTDAEAAEWGYAACEENGGAEALTALKAEIAEAAAAGEEARVMLLYDLCGGFSSGVSAFLIRELRAAFGDALPFLGAVCLTDASVSTPNDDIASARSALKSLDERGMLRETDGRETSGLDALWLLGLPASFVSEESSRRVLSFAAARILGEAFTAGRLPAPGLHTRALGGTLSLHALGNEAKQTSSFVRGAVWCLCDLLPALKSYLGHPVLLRSLTPATRNGLFKRLFRKDKNKIAEPGELPVLERALKAVLLELLTLLRTLPAPLRLSGESAELWDRAVKACGRAVTVASEYDVCRKETEESGLDKVMPVHRSSMEDTEEESLLRKLDDMSDSLSAALEDRSAALAALGGYRARQALEDCASRCAAAEESAREKLKSMPSDTQEERFRIGLQARRLRMLEAAVARCGNDLKQAAAWPAYAGKPSRRQALSPYAGEILNEESAALITQLITGGDTDAETAAGKLQEQLGGLFAGYSLSDCKTLFKNLLALCRQPGGTAAPLAELTAAAFSVCASDSAQMRILSPGGAPDLRLLPDMADSGNQYTLRAVIDGLLPAEGTPDVSAQRGALAALLLMQYRRRSAEDAVPEYTRVSAADSAFARVWLSARKADAAYIVSLRKKEESLPFAVLLPRVGIEPARLGPDHLKLLPSFVTWTAADRPVSLTDPCALLGDSDRQILTEQLTCMRSLLKGAETRPFSQFLLSMYQDTVRGRRPDLPDPLLEKRMKAACALHHLPAWKQDVSRVTAFYEHFIQEDVLCARLCGADRAPASRCNVEDEVTYTYRGTPFARECSDTLLEGSGLPGDARILSSLDAECAVLARSSDDYHDALYAGVSGLLDRWPKASPEARETAEKLLKEAKAPVSDAETALDWPWDEASASVRTIILECVGPRLADACAQPFSDRLTVFPARGGDILGDILLDRACRIENELPSPDPETEEEEDPDGPAPVRPADDAVLPPFSPGFACALCRSPEGRTLLGQDMLRFERKPDGVHAVITLKGAFTLRLRRVYHEDEILRLYAHEIPTLAVWPGVPFPREDWRAYFAYAHLPVSFAVRAFTQDAEVALPNDAARACARLDAFPVCFALESDRLSLGALPNLLPVPEVARDTDAVVCVDFGSSGAAAVLRCGGSLIPLTGSTAARILLRNPASSAGLMKSEFLPLSEESPVFPASVRVFRNVPGATPVPFADGCLLRADGRELYSLTPDALFTDLKWGEEKGRGASLCLHQIMLETALKARLSGARTLCWRFSVPEGLAPEGRKNWGDLVTSLAAAVAEETALPLPGDAPPAVFAAECTAAGAYFRFIRPEDTRSGFMTLDIGANTSDIALFLRGGEEPARVCRLPLGLWYMLLPEMMRDPDVLVSDFGFIPDEGLQRELGALRAALAGARTDPAAFRYAKLCLDTLIAERGAQLHEALYRRMTDGMPGRTGALLLLYFSSLMMLSGLMLYQLSGDSNRNDLLPGRIRLCLSGRGSVLPEHFSPRAKDSLSRMLTMFRNPRVSDIGVLFSPERKSEIAAGLACLERLSPEIPRMPAAPSEIPVRPDELMYEFLSRFFAEFPAEATLLFPDWFSGDPYHPFTETGLRMIRAAVDMSFPGAGSPRPYDSLAACVASLPELAGDGR